MTVRVRVITFRAYLLHLIFYHVTSFSLHDHPDNSDDHDHDDADDADPIPPFSLATLHSAYSRRQLSIPVPASVPPSVSPPMSPTSVSPPGEPEKPASSFFIPPPLQRLSRSLTGLPSSFQSPADRPMHSSSAPLPGPNRALSSVDPPPSQPSSSRPSSIFPRLHKLEIADDMASNQSKPPLLELKLSSSAFLDAVATDTESDKPLYAVETVGASTTVWRSDPWDGSAKIADLRWPKDLPLKGKCRDQQGAMIQMDEPRWREVTSLLKCSGLGSSRKFHIPHHPHALKWKREGTTYMCTTPNCKGAVAILDSFNDADTAPRLTVFETLGSFHQSVPQLDHAGISLSFLDHLFVTALLLVTEPQDWMTLARNPTSLDGAPSSAPLRVASTSRASNRQWRKIMYGEPMYPSLKTPAFDKGTVDGGEDADVLDISDPPPLLASRRQWRKIVYGEPLYPSLRPQSADELDLPPRPSSATSFSSESYSPPTPSSAPSTGFYDSMSLFDDTERPTSRRGSETRGATSPTAPSSGTLSPMPSSECIPLSPFPISPAPGTRRELPSPPSSYQPPRSIQPWLHRSRSSPKLSLSSQSPTLSAVDQEDATNQSLLTRIAMGANVRQLPTPPQQELPVQSQKTGPLEMRRWSQTHQRSLPPTPGSVSRSSSTQPQHTHTQSHEVASLSLPISTIDRPSTSHQGSTVGVQNDGGRRARHEKDPDEVINWMRSLTRAHRRRMFDGEDYEPGSSPSYDGGYEAPPAYNAIDFSMPPQARSPMQGTQS